MTEISTENTTAADTTTLPVEPSPTTVAAPAQEDKEDTTALKKALKAERDRAKQFEQQLATVQKVFEGIDPQKYKELQAAQQAALQEAEKAQQAILAARAEVEAEYTAKLRQEQQRLSQEQATAKNLQTQLQGLIKRTQAEKLFTLANGRTGGGDDVTFFDTFYQAVSGLLSLDESGGLIVLGSNGKPLEKEGKQITPKEYFESLATHTVFGHYFEPRNDNRGSGMPPTSAQRSIGGKPDFSQIKDPATRLSKIREYQASQR